MKNILISSKNHTIELITNGRDKYENMVLCFHGFNGDKWGDAYKPLKSLENSLVCSFDSCGHGDSHFSSEEMRLDIILEEIDVVVNYLKNLSNKPIILVSVSYGSYRVLEYLIKYRPAVEKVIYINPAFNMLKTLEKVKEFDYLSLKEDDKVIMKRSLNKYITKQFLDDLYFNNLYNLKFNIKYDTEVIIGTKDILIPVEDTLKIANLYNYNVTYVDDDHCLQDENNWKMVADIIKEIK